MNFSKIFSHISPFFILGIISILWATINMILIYTYKKEDVVSLPYFFILLITGIVILFLDRWAIGLWGQKLVTWTELILIPIFYLVFSFLNKKIIICPADGIQYFGVVYEVENKKASATEYTFPFNRSIKINSDDQIVFLTKNMWEKYRLDISTDCSIYINGKNEKIADETYSINVYSLCHEPSDTENKLEEIIQKIKE